MMRLAKFLPHLSQILKNVKMYSTYGNAMRLQNIVWHYFFLLFEVFVLNLYEPPRGKTNNVVSDQARHKLACTSTEKS